jgi:diamine N-acetyltransferase
VEHKLNENELNLLEVGLDFAKAEGTISIQLIVCEFNKNAIKFYESVGMSARNRKMEL